ncbi:MAG TPA: hydantoinase/oxoprolinase family protein [Candidatus Limnocylindrales bacterium]|nr:hydantoinase/oxoprolinase family protein [Candidatus Limnocylindrales bacterium]
MAPTSLQTSRQAGWAGTAVALTIGLDMGGTFVDCVVAAERGLAVGKAPTTRPDPIAGLLDALADAARDAGLSLEELLARAGDLAHGTTLGLNAVLTRNGGTVGLLTTRGHEDALLIGRVHQKVAGLRPQELTRASQLRKPEPLVPRWRIRGIDERIDADGREVVELDEAGVAEATRDLVAAGCDAIAITFLWSFRAPAHERRAAAIAAETCPGVPIVVSSDVAPVLGEYERSAATVVDAFLVRPFGGYVTRLGAELRRLGFSGNLWLMGMTGGLSPAAVAASRPVETLRSGPVGGTVAGGRVGARLGRQGVITADMGGTSFDVGLIVDGRPETVGQTIVGQLHLAVPAVDVRSIGAGGGSIAWLDEQGGLHVGPRSAGAQPGPACYGQGGTEPTVTDADVVLGRLDPGAVLANRIPIDADAARSAIDRLADRLGVDPVAAAAGIVDVADAQMADLVRTMTVERGHDPRDFLLVVFGGAGPLHVGRFASDVGVLEAVVPPAASVLSALGLAVAEYRRTYRRSRRMSAPPDPAIVHAIFEELENRAVADFRATGLTGEPTVERWVELRYRRQTHQLRVPVPSIERGAASLGGLVTAFEERYARTYGAGTGYAAAGIEATTFGLDLSSPRRHEQGDGTAEAVSVSGTTAPAARRRVYFESWIDTPVYGGDSLRRGIEIQGPAVVDWPTTTLVIHPDQSVGIGPAGDVHLRLRPEGAR